jgi:hypothetical protein
VVAERFPRLATDQTASLLTGVNLDPVPVLATALRKLAPNETH